MENSYLVKYLRNIKNDDWFKDDKFQDAYVELSKPRLNNNAALLSIRTHEKNSDPNNYILLNKYITKSFGKVEFNDSEKTCDITYFDGYGQNISYTSTIKFDSSSFSAYEKFKTNFQELQDTKYETKYHKSGKIEYVGELLKSDKGTLYHGNGKCYFDNYLNSIKYDGDFEEGCYDGSGIFYNSSNYITLRSLNISNGIPTQKGKLIINFCNKHEIIDINFNQLWEILGLTTKIQKAGFVLQDNFVDKIAELYWNLDYIDKNELEFRNMNTTDQNVLMLNELKLINEKTKNMNKLIIQIKNNENNIKYTYYQVLIISLCIIWMIIFPK